MPFEFISATAWIDNNGGIDGYNLPFLPSYMSLGYIAHSNWFVAFAREPVVHAVRFWYVALSYLAFPRIIFAWGMDRMGPKWFTSINPRWASPVKNYILCFVLCQAAIALYSFWLGSYMQGLTVTGMEIVSVWGVTTVAALLFPYMRSAPRASGTSSPYKTWKFLGVPADRAGAPWSSLVYLGILFYFLIFTEEMKDSNGQSWILYGIVWVIGIVWYLFWAAAQQERRRGRQHDLRGAAAGVSPAARLTIRRPDGPGREHGAGRLQAPRPVRVWGLGRSGRTAFASVPQARARAVGFGSVRNSQVAETETSLESS